MSPVDCLGRAEMACTSFICWPKIWLFLLFLRDYSGIGLETAPHFSGKSLLSLWGNKDTNSSGCLSPITFTPRTARSFILHSWDVNSCQDHWNTDKANGPEITSGLPDQPVVAVAARCSWHTRKKNKKFPVRTILRYNCGHLVLLQNVPPPPGMDMIQRESRMG